MDSSFIKADIFFAVTTAAVIILTGLAVAVLVYIIGIVRTIKKISATAKRGAESVVEGITEAKESMSQDGYILSNIFDIFKKVAQKRSHSKSKTKK
jgi:hypothetical protein